MKQIAKDNKKILIVDDESDICTMVTDILTPYFETIDSCDRSIQASNMILESDYDLIITDINMPEMDGPSLIRHARKNGVLTPFIFLTGKAQKETLIAGMRLGVGDIIEKPFDVDVLILSARRLIEINKRQQDWILAKNNPNLTKEQLSQKKKMIGLFLVSSEQLKVG